MEITDRSAARFVLETFVKVVNSKMELRNEGSEGGNREKTYVNSTPLNLAVQQFSSDPIGRRYRKGLVPVGADSALAAAAKEADVPDCDTKVPWSGTSRQPLPGLECVDPPVATFTCVVD